MNVAMDKTRLAEKRYWDKLEKGKTEFKLNKRKHKKNKKKEKVKKIIQSTIINYKNQKRQQKYKK